MRLGSHVVPGERDKQLLCPRGQVTKQVMLNRREIGESVYNDKFQARERGTTAGGESIAGDPQPAFTIGERMFRQQVFIVGIELGEFTVLPKVGAAASRFQELPRLDAASLEFSDVLKEQIDKAGR
jgi:hypothetical protein